MAEKPLTEITSEEQSELSGRIRGKRARVSTESSASNEKERRYDISARC